MLYRLGDVSTYPVPEKVSDIFDPSVWREVQGFEFQDITYHRHVERDADGNWVRDLGTVRIAFDRPEVRNAFRPGTVDRSEEHTSELQSRFDLVCRLLLEKTTLV